MLERVPATAESAAHVFLRNFERPQPSGRLLDPRFWQHECDQLVPSRTSAPWWPQFLQNVRQVPQQSGSTDSTRRVRPFSWKRSPRIAPAEHNPRRCFSRTPRHSAAPARQNDIYHQFGSTENIEPEKDEEDDKDDDEDELSEDEEMSAADTTIPLTVRAPQKKPVEAVPNTGSFSPFRAAERKKPTPSPEEQRQRQKELQQARKAEPWRLLRPEEAAAVSVPSSDKLLIINHLLDHNDTQPFSEQRLDQIWQLFIALPDQTALARRVFDCFAGGKAASLKARASTAFDLMPTEKRTTADYEKAILLRLAQDHVQAAIALAAETDEKNPWGHFEFLSTQLVRKGLWNSLSKALSPRHIGLSLFRGCANIQTLPQAILALHKRVEDCDEILEMPLTLRRIITLLTRVCFTSEMIMRTVPTDLLISLLRLPHNGEACHTVALATLARAGDRAGKKDVALAIYRDLLSTDSSHVVSPATLGSLLVVCGHSGYFPDVYKYILDEFARHFGKPSLKSYLLVLTLCARRGSIAECQAFFGRFLADHPAPPSIKYVSPVIQVCARMGNRELTTKYFDEVSTKYGFEQDIHCWNMLMAAYARSEPTTEAFDVFRRMTEAGVRPDSYSYGILMAVCADLEDSKGAERLLEQAREEGVPVTVAMIGTLVDAYLSQDRWDIARQFVVTMSKSDTSESLTRRWNSLLRYCAMKGLLNQLNRTRNEMQEYGIKPDGWTYATMMMSLTLAKKTSEALEYFRSLVNDKRLIASPLHYSIILYGLIQERRWDKAASILKQLLAQFQGVDNEAKEAMFAKIARTSVSDPHETETVSLDLMTSIFKDIEANEKDDRAYRPNEEGLSVNTPTKSYIDILLHAMRRNKQTSSAEQLMNRLQDRGLSGAHTTRQIRHRYVQLVTLKMESALAQSDWKTVETLWAELFAKQSSRPTSVSHLLKSPENLPEPSFSEAKAFSLSRPLNRYMQAMILQKRQLHMIVEIRKFEKAGYKLSGANWNKYVQAMTQSKYFNHRLAAFKMVESDMINRAQSWTLLRRGLLRTENVSYSFAQVTPDKPRPVLEKKKTYSTTNRLSALHSNPARKIPTYTTMVHLAGVLQFAQQKAINGDDTLLRYIGAAARRTKYFVERMPRLKDDLQYRLLKLGDPNGASVRGVLERPRSVAKRPALFDTGSDASGPVRPVRSTRPYALGYMERRRLRDMYANRQRRKADRFIRAGGYRQILQATSAAGRRFKRRQEGIRRRSALLDEIEDEGKPKVSPLPKTRTGYRRRRRVLGSVAVRFVFELARSKKRFAVRRGLIPEERQGLAEVDQSEYMVSEKAGHLLLRRAPGARLRSNHPRSFVHGKVPTGKYLVRVGRLTGRGRAARVIGQRKAALRKALEGMSVPDPEEKVGWQPFS